MMLTFMLVLIAISLITLKMTRGDRDSDIPKWVPRVKNEKDSDEETDDQL